LDAKEVSTLGGERSDAPHIRRIKNIIAAIDGEFLPNVKYSKLNVPVEIAIPQ